MLLPNVFSIFINKQQQSLPGYSTGSNNSCHCTLRVEAGANALLGDSFSKVLYCQCLAGKLGGSG